MNSPIEVVVAYWLEREVQLTRQPHGVNRLVVSTKEGHFLIDRDRVPDSDSERASWLADLLETDGWKLSCHSIQLHIPDTKVMSE